MMVFTKESLIISIKSFFTKTKTLLYQRLLHLSLSDKIILVGSIIGLISLFCEWILFEEISRNSFHSLTGANGYLLFILIILLMSFTLSIHYKQKLKLYSGFSFNDYHLAIIVGILLIILPINSIVFINGLSAFSEAIHGNGIGLSITSGILVFAGALFKKKELNNGDISLYTIPQESHKGNIELSQTPEDNMKLPF